jgi:hypothetical protein
MAGSGRKVWAADEILAAADLQDYIQDQTVMRYASVAARTSGILAPTEGMVTYLDDANALFVYDGAAWVAVVADGSINTNKLATGAVTTDKIANSAVDVNKIADGNVTNVKLASGIDASKITTGTLPSAQLPTIPTSYLGTGNWNMGVATLTTTNVSAGATITCTDFNASSSVTGTGSVYGPGTYNQTNTGRAMYVASNGLFGIGSSSERFKENIEDAVIDVDAVLDVQVRNFTYKPDFSDDQSVQVGVIAEELVALGLSEFVFFDVDGNADGVAYEKLALALIPVVQVQQARLDSFEARLSRLEK